MSDTAKRIAQILNEHHPERGMVVASGVTCQCGYWTGDEIAGVTRPAGVSGADKLDWHRAKVLSEPGFVDGAEVSES